jgi:uncharacterized membrane protein YeaQ/YmgE (transglycosylase-associated protein family)
MTFATVLGGVCALLLGRRLFWLFVGVVGFVTGSSLATTLYAGAPPTEIFVIALAAGIIGAALAYALQEVMIGIAGFAAGSGLASRVLLTTVPHPGRGLWIALLIGGCVGAVVFVAVFDWAVIIISSIFGADLLVRAFQGSESEAPLAVLGLALVGIVIQASAMRGRPP